jgi:hypothetical protein
MSLDYRKFKTPFYEISVGDSRGSKLIPLPHHILRLVSKIEIVETLEPGNYDTLKITFVEGSREPASPDSFLGTNGLYKIPTEGDRIDMDIAGSLTNRPGIITDLRFSGSGGITFLTKQEQKAKAIDRTLQKNVEKDIVTRAYPNEPDSPRLLFQERNQIQITWGYKEDPDTVRTIRSYIAIVSVKFQESGATLTEITCNDSMHAADQITPSKGIRFGRRKKTGTGNSIITFEDQTTSELVEEICQRAGIDCIVSPDLPNQKLDKEHTKTWVAGESFIQFLTKLAEKNNAVFKILPDPTTGLDTLMYINKTDFDKRVVIRDKNLLTWKAPGSILKDVSINVDFGSIPGVAEAGITKSGDSTVINARGNSEQVLSFKTEGKVEETVDTDTATSTNSIAVSKGLTNITGEDYSYKTVINPSENRQDKEDGVNVKTAQSMQRIIQLDFTTIGFTRVSPGTVELGNLGVRYSGKYRILTATHTIDSSGYITKAKCESGAFAAGGTVNPLAKVQEDFVSEDKETVRSFKKEEEPTNSSDLSNRIDKLKGLPKGG